MISVFDMAMALTESAEHGFHSGGVSVQPMYIPESMNICESIEYVNNEIMLEAADYAVFSSQVDDLMMEAAMKNPEIIGSLSENVITNIGASIKKFFTKVIAGIKTIINRIKEFFAKFTGKTEKWVSLIEPRIAKLGGYSGDATIVNDYKWDEKLVSEGLAAGIAAVLNDATKFKDFKDIIDCDVVDFDVALANGKGDDATIDRAIESLDKEIEAVKKAESDSMEMLMKEIKIGGGATTTEEFFKNIDKAVRGGEKVDRKASELGGINGMMAFIKKSPETATKLKDAYEKMQKTYEDTSSKWEKKINTLSAQITKREAGLASFTGHDKRTMYVGTHITGQQYGRGDIGMKNHGPSDSELEKQASKNANKNMKNAGSAYTSKYQQYLQAKASILMKGLSTVNSLAGGLQSRNLSYLQEITRNYMNNVTKCVASAGKKEK